ncbi:uncharacterized protein LOC144447713 [Glandiceps talaboti]
MRHRKVSYVKNVVLKRKMTKRLTKTTTRLRKIFFKIILLKRKMTNRLSKTKTRLRKVSHIKNVVLKRKMTKRLSKTTPHHRKIFFNKIVLKRKMTKSHGIFLGNEAQKDTSSEGWLSDIKTSFCCLSGWTKDEKNDVDEKNTPSKDIICQDCIPKEEKDKNKEMVKSDECLECRYPEKTKKVMDLKYDKLLLKLLTRYIEKDPKLKESVEDVEQKLLEVKLEEAYLDTHQNVEQELPTVLSFLKDTYFAKLSEVCKKRPEVVDQELLKKSLKNHLEKNAELLKKRAEQIEEKMLKLVLRDYFKRRPENIPKSELLKVLLKRFFDNSSKQLLGNGKENEVQEHGVELQLLTVLLKNFLKCSKHSGTSDTRVKDKSGESKDTENMCLNCLDEETKKEMGDDNNNASLKGIRQERSPKEENDQKLLNVLLERYLQKQSKWINKHDNSKDNESEIFLKVLLRGYFDKCERSYKICEKEVDEHSSDDKGYEKEFELSLLKVVIKDVTDTHGEVRNEGSSIRKILEVYLKEEIDKTVVENNTASSKDILQQNSSKEENDQKGNEAQKDTSSEGWLSDIKTSFCCLSGWTKDEKNDVDEKNTPSKDIICQDCIPKEEKDKNKEMVKSDECLECRYPEKTKKVMELDYDKCSLLDLLGRFYFMGTSGLNGICDKDTQQKLFPVLLKVYFDVLVEVRNECREVQLLKVLIKIYFNKHLKLLKLRSQGENQKMHLLKVLLIGFFKNCSTAKVRERIYRNDQEYQKQFEDMKDKATKDQCNLVRFEINELGGNQDNTDELLKRLEQYIEEYPRLRYRWKRLIRQ